ncbi:MAG: nucleoside deaminase [Christensenellales bacterium]
MQEQMMQEAIREARMGILRGDGGPFGAVVVQGGKIIGRGHNCVIRDQDPTCHGEIEAIRDACRHIGSLDLSGADIYTTSEPCPMCLGAVLWAGIRAVYYGCDRNDAEGIGFRDRVFYEVMDRGACRLIPAQREACLKLFQEYAALPDRQPY